MAPCSGPNAAMVHALNLPNALTLLRLVLAPVIAGLLLQREDLAALVLFAFAAASDFADGRLARRWHQRTRFGAVLDPLADKTTGALVLVVFAWQGSVPIWFAAAALVRDLVILGGAAAWRLAIGELEMAPTAVSKLNTALLFCLLLAILGARAGVLPGGEWLDVLMVGTLATVVVSGVQYVVVWARKARASPSWRG